MSAAKLSVGIICGGPSPERGISLNSARSLMDHLRGAEFDIKVIYVNKSLEFFLIDKEQLYSNTPSDFDFKLQGKKLNTPIDILKSVDIVFPVIHGKYGEDGKIQKLLEDNDIAFVGSSSESCSAMFSKSNINKVLKVNGFDTTELITIDVNKPDLDLAEKLIKSKSKVIVKPNSSGSSICVYSAATVDEVNDAVRMIKTVDDTAVVEELCEGSEFTVIVLQNDKPVALVPTQIEILSENKIFDYRKKYLPTNSTRWISPPKFSKEIIRYIMQSVERIFGIFQMRDFVRIDGWVLNDGRVIFSDINPVCGMEQNSFLFQQAAWVGMTHKNVLKLILKSAFGRYQIAMPISNVITDKQKVAVIFGGDSAERQVSLMSGTNVWLKLLNSKHFQPVPYMLDGDSVWYLPYQYTMNHTVEEIKHNCCFSADIMENLKDYIESIQKKLDIKYDLTTPYRMSIDEFLQEVQLLLHQRFVFLALHGGVGEDGTIQTLLEKHQIRYNGSDSKTSKLCMDKYETGKCLVQSTDIELLPKILCKVQNSQLVFVQSSYEKKITYALLLAELFSDKFIIKPCNDGCSAGVIKIGSQADLDKYVGCILSGDSNIILKTQSEKEIIVEMPQNAVQKEYIIEPFIEVDKIEIHNDSLIVDTKSGWTEMTVVVTENQNHYHAFNPSITIAANTILTIEEKFQGGTGINLTPPPREIISLQQVMLIKNNIELIANDFKIKDYARMDIFFNKITNKLILIEINTLPALTPSTVLFHQALSEDPPIYPLDFLESLIHNNISNLIKL